MNSIRNLLMVAVSVFALSLLWGVAASIPDIINFVISAPLWLHLVFGSLGALVVCCLLIEKYDP